VTALEVGIGESAERPRSGNGFALALPSRRAIEIGRSLLQRIQDGPSTLGIDAILGDSPHDLGERDLHGVHVLRERQVERGVIAAPTSASSFHAASAKVEMEVAVVATVECGRTAVDAIFLEMVTGTNWHVALQNSGLSAVSHQLSANDDS
jgi:hypothetical protein